MELLANDLSVDEQFDHISGFREALSRLMKLRVVANRFGREIRCDSTFLILAPIPGIPMQQAIGKLASMEERRAIMSWLNKRGSFWDDERIHGEDDWLECDEEIVTNTAVGEAAYRVLHDLECGLISLAPSWHRSPIDVTWVRKDEDHRHSNAKVENWWCAETLDRALQQLSWPLGSWDELREVSVIRFKRLVFTESCFAPLAGVPFASSAANQLMARLSVLDRLARAFNSSGGRSAEGHRIYQDHFTGDAAHFSDSSDSEKHKFRRVLTFPDPTNTERSLFCPWHGKIRYMTLRLHFSWPIVAGRPVYVVYAGPKITKR